MEIQWNMRKKEKNNATKKSSKQTSKRDNTMQSWRRENKINNKKIQINITSKTQWNEGKQE